MDSDTENRAIKTERIAWLDALLAPNVLLYASCLFCLKFAIYAILLWMPLYLSQVKNFDND